MVQGVCSIKHGCFHLWVSPIPQITSFFFGLGTTVSTKWEITLQHPTWTFRGHPKPHQKHEFILVYHFPLGSTTSLVQIQIEDRKPHVLRGHDPGNWETYVRFLDKWAAVRAFFVGYTHSTALYYCVPVGFYGVNWEAYKQMNRGILNIYQHGSWINFIKWWRELIETA